MTIANSTAMQDTYLKNQTAGQISEHPTGVSMKVFCMRVLLAHRIIQEHPMVRQDRHYKMILLQIKQQECTKAILDIFQRLKEICWITMPHLDLKKPSMVGYKMSALPWEETNNGMKSTTP